MKLIEKLRLIIKLFLILLISFTLEFTVLILQIFTAPFGFRKQTGALIAVVWGWLLVKVTGVKITVYGKRKKLDEGVFFVSNHSSYIDIFVLFSLFKLNFVAKAEIRKWPLIGFLAYCGGTIFVNRKKTSQAKKYVDELLHTIKKGSNILIFPEGTSTRGDNILPFFSSLFQAPLEVRKNIQPIYIQYYAFNGKKIKDNPELIDKMSWYADMELVPHVKELFKAKNSNVRVFIGNIIDTNDFSVDSAGRKALAQTCYDEILRLKAIAENQE